MRDRTNTADHTNPSTGALLTAGEVSALLRVTKAWVYAETRAGRLPHVRLGRYVRYRLAAIERWVEDAEQPSIRLSSTPATVNGVRRGERRALRRASR